MIKNITKSIFWALLVVISAAVLQAQGDVVSEKKVSMSLGPQNCFYVELQGADKKVNSLGKKIE
jgi:hypothetical protein